MLNIDPKQISVNWPNARSCLEMSARAYNLGPNYSEDPVPVIVQNRATDAHALIQKTESAIIVAFRGSCEPEDFIQDAKFEKATVIWLPWEEHAQVHRGFLEDFESLNEDILEVVSGLRASHSESMRDASPLPIFVTGHSLGGALAILCALEFSRSKFNVAGVYTFGQPRVGNRAFARLYNGAPAPCSGMAGCLGDITFRVVNENDIVPRVPLPFGYRHCGTRVFLSCPSGVLINPAWYKTADSDLRGFYHAVRKHIDVLVGDHYLKAYQKRMEKP